MKTATKQEFTNQMASRLIQIFSKEVSQNAVPPFEVKSSHVGKKQSAQSKLGYYIMFQLQHTKNGFNQKLQRLMCRYVKTIVEALPPHITIDTLNGNGLIIQKTIEALLRQEKQDFLMRLQGNERTELAA